MQAKNANKKTPERNCSFLFVPPGIKSWRSSTKKGIKKTIFRSLQTFEVSKFHVFKLPFWRISHETLQIPPRNQHPHERIAAAKRKTASGQKLGGEVRCATSQVTCLVHFRRVPNELQFLEFLGHISHPINKVYFVYSTSVGVWEPRTRKTNGGFFIPF